MSDDKGPCPACQGHGRVKTVDAGTRNARTVGDPAGPLTCPRCGGSGKAKLVPRTK